MNSMVEKALLKKTTTKKHKEQMLPEKGRMVRSDSHVVNNSEPRIQEKEPSVAREKLVIDFHGQFTTKKKHSFKTILDVKLTASAKLVGLSGFLFLSFGVGFLGVFLFVCFFGFGLVYA